MAALRPLTLDRLERALGQPGCPVCNEMEQSTSRYLHGLIQEHKGANGVWQRLQRTWGLCRQHKRGLLAEEPRTLRGHGTAALYRWLAEAMLKQAGGPGARLTPAEFRLLLKPEGMCLACEQLGEYQRAVVRGLVRTLESGDPSSVRAAYFRGDGLCLPHLRLAFGVVDDRDTASALGQRFLKGIESCATGLERVLASSADAATAPPAATPDEVGMRAVERFSGRLGT